MKNITLVAALLLARLPVAQAAEQFWDEIPVSPSTTRPTVVLDGYWNSEYQRVNREIAAAKNCQLVFFGDSITWSWSLGPATGKELWGQQFGPFNPINMGNSGDITPVMLHRVTRGNLDFPTGQHPKVAVLLCGINNFGVTKSAGGKEQWDLGINCPSKDIANGQRAIAQVFRRKLPHTRIIMLALLPLADRGKWEKCKQVNEIQAAVARDNDEVAFINLHESFLLPDGSLNKSLYTDGLHLSVAGYQAWARGIESKMDVFLKAPPLAPTKIMLIGGVVTEGRDSSRSYRRYLDGLLRRRGHLIDFVGSRHKHDDDRIEADDYQFDTDHEGYSGKDFAWLADKMPRLLEQNVPDIAVLQLGADDTAADVTASITALRSKNSQVKIVIAHPKPAKEADESFTLLAKSVSSAQSPVVFANIGKASDTKEPDADDARKMGAILADAIAPLIRSRNLFR